MFEHPRGSARERAPGGRSGWTARSPAWVLPVAGAVSFAVGLFLAVDRSVPWGVYAPELLSLLGAATLVSGLARLGLPRARPVESRAPAQRTTAESWVICPSCSARSIEAVTPRTSRSGRASDPSRAVVSWAAPATNATGPGDFARASWVAEVRTLPADRVGPVPETAYIPHRPGAPSLYEEGAPPLLASSASDDDRERAAPAVVAESDAPSSRSLATADVPGSGVVATTVRKDRGHAIWTSRDAVVLGNSIEGRVLREALNPTPPHLRPPSRRAPVAPTERLPLSDGPGTGVRCANCNDPVLAPAPWRRCPDCLSSLCAECVVSALLTHERGWCSRCAELRHLESLGAEPAPRARLSTGAVGLTVVPELLSPSSDGGADAPKPRSG